MLASSPGRAGQSWTGQDGQICIKKEGHLTRRCSEIDTTNNFGGKALM